MTRGCFSQRPGNHFFRCNYEGRKCPLLPVFVGKWESYFMDTSLQVAKLPLFMKVLEVYFPLDKAN